MLPKKHRLSLDRKTQIKGKRERFELFDLVIRENKEGKPRFGIIVPAKVIKKAVDRNRARRLIYKAFENLPFGVCNFDLLVIVKKDPTFLKSQDLTSLLKEDLVRIGLSK